MISRLFRRMPRGTGSLLLALACAALLLSARAGASAAARWLSTGGPPRNADLLVVVAGGARERLQTGADLFRRGYAPEILVTEPMPQDGMEALLGMAPGAGGHRLHACADRVTSTVGDALCVRQLVESRGFRSILVVTSPYHCRRLEMIFRRTLGDLDLDIRVVGSASLYWPPESWWRYPAGWEVPAELAKLTWSWVTVPKRHKVAK